MTKRLATKGERGSSKGEKWVTRRCNIAPDLPKPTCFGYAAISGKPENSYLAGSPPVGGEDRELKCEAVSGARNPEWMENLTPERLRSLASADFQLYLDHETEQGAISSHR